MKGPALSETQSDLSNPVRVGGGRFRYRTVPGWGAFPPGCEAGEVVGIATDSKNRAYVFNRGENPVVVFDEDGRFLGSWGQKEFVRPHGIHIGSDDSVYCTDDVDHTVRKYTVDGRLLLKLGTSGKGADTGVTGVDYRTISRVGPPFHRPTNLTVARDGTLLVADGYGNARIHRFSSGGELLHSWGSPGSGPGQFNLPHGIAVDSSSRVYVADRENSRVQIFSPAGEFLAQWIGLGRPTEVFIDPQDNVFVSELGWQAALFPWHVPPANGSLGRLSIFDLDGSLQARWGGGGNPAAPGDFFAPHDVWADRAGDLYVSEVLVSAGSARNPFRQGHPLQKFARIP